MKTDAERLARIERAVGKIAELLSLFYEEESRELEVGTLARDEYQERSEEAAAIDREFSEPKTEEGE